MAEPYSNRIRITRDLANSLKPLKLLDIGCGSCGIADIFSDAGHEVHVTDSSDARIPDKWRSRFTKARCLEISVDGYDGVILAGLLYHLSLESQLKLLTRVDDKRLFIDTHYVLGHETFTGTERKPTASSEQGCQIPCIQWLQKVIEFPGQFDTLELSEKHTPDRRWLIRANTSDFKGRA